MQNRVGEIGVWLGVVGLVMIAVAGCAAHRGGVQTGVIEAPKPTRMMARATGNDLNTLGRGYSAYMTQCAQCHEYKLPDDLSRAAWHKANWNVGMEKEDEQALVKYLLAEIATR